MCARRQSASLASISPPKISPGLRIPLTISTPMSWVSVPWMRGESRLISTTRVSCRRNHAFEANRIRAAVKAAFIAATPRARHRSVGQYPTGWHPARLPAAELAADSGDTLAEESDRSPACDQCGGAVACHCKWLAMDHCVADLDGGGPAIDDDAPGLLRQHRQLRCGITGIAVHGCGQLPPGR